MGRERAGRPQKGAETWTHAASARIVLNKPTKLGLIIGGFFGPCISSCSSKLLNQTTQPNTFKKTSEEDAYYQPKNY